MSSRRPVVLPHPEAMVGFLVLHHPDHAAGVRGWLEPSSWHRAGFCAVFLQGGILTITARALGHPESQRERILQCRMPLPLPSESRTTSTDSRHSYIDAVCYKSSSTGSPSSSPTWCSLHTLIFAACSNFWLHYPAPVPGSSILWPSCTSASILRGTTRALSETVAEQSVRPLTLSKSKVLLASGCSAGGVDSNKQSLALPTAWRESAGIESPTSSVLDKKEGLTGQSHLWKSEEVPPARGAEGHHLSALPEADHSQSHSVCPHHNLRSIFSNLHHSGNWLHSVDVQAFTGYKRYQCVYSLAEISQVLASFYVIWLYFLRSHSVLQLVVDAMELPEAIFFEALREKSNYSDIPDVKNDFAFYPIWLISTTRFTPNASPYSCQRSVRTNWNRSTSTMNGRSRS